MICVGYRRRRCAGSSPIFRCRTACRDRERHHLRDQEWPAWRDAPAKYGPPKMIYDRFIRWRRLGTLNNIFAAVAAEGLDVVMVSPSGAGAIRMWKPATLVPMSKMCCSCPSDMMHPAVSNDVPPR